MTDVLHYRGCVDIDRSQIMGPDLHGAYYRPLSATYDAYANMTTVSFQPGTLDSLRGQIAAEVTA